MDRDLPYRVSAGRKKETMIFSDTAVYLVAFKCPLSPYLLASLAHLIHVTVLLTLLWSCLFLSPLKVCGEPLAGLRRRRGWRQRRQGKEAGCSHRVVPQVIPSVKSDQIDRIDHDVDRLNQIDQTDHDVDRLNRIYQMCYDVDHINQIDEIDRDLDQLNQIDQRDHGLDNFNHIGQIDDRDHSNPIPAVMRFCAGKRVLLVDHAYYAAPTGPNELDNARAMCLP